MPTATLFATPRPAGDTMTGIRINRAVAQPGAKGKKGFLLYAAASAPKPTVDAIMRAALAQVDPSMVQASARAAGAASPPDKAGPTITKMGRFGGFGDDANLVTIGVDPTSVSDSTTAAINATDSGAASPSWLDSISSAIQAAGTAYLTKTQVDAQQQIFNVNLQRAQHGLPPIPTNPTAYGLPAPTVNFGLAGGTQSTLMWLAGGLGVIILLASFAKSGAHKR
jgi:hypothetical protein